jgi:hypothetical protein
MARPEPRSGFPGLLPGGDSLLKDKTAMKTMALKTRWIHLGFALFLVCGCATTKKSADTEMSGFLGDYSQFREGTKDEAQLVYINPAAKLSKYDKVIIDPVAIWSSVQGSDESYIPEAELQMLADYLHGVLHNELFLDYKIVESPGPGALRIRTALTEAKKTDVAMGIVANVMPPMLIADTAKTMATGTAMFVGRAAVEMEIVDSVSNERLLAAVDQRVGTKAFRGKSSSWSHVQEAFDYWAQRLKLRLEMLRNQP